MHPIRTLVPVTAALVLAVTACGQNAAPPAAETSGEAAEAGTPALEAMAPVIEAARDRPVDGDVWYQRITWAEAWGVGPGDDRYGVYSVYRTEEWSWQGEYDIATGEFEGEAAGLSAKRTNETAWALVDEARRDAWERDGSPGYWPYDPRTERTEIPTREEELNGEITGPWAGGWDLGLGSVTHPDLGELPTDPAELEELMFSVPEGEAENPAYQEALDTEYELLAERGYADEEARHFSYVAETLAVPFPPEVRAGMYTLLAGLPGVRPVEEATDVSGRAAVGVAYTLAPTARGTFEQRLLFDPVTGDLLSDERVVVEPAESEADWSEPGHVVEYTLYETSDWIAEPPL